MATNATRYQTLNSQDYNLYGNSNMISSYPYSYQVWNHHQDPQDQHILGPIISTTTPTMTAIPPRPISRPPPPAIKPTHTMYSSSSPKSPQHPPPMRKAPLRTSHCAIQKQTTFQNQQQLLQQELLYKLPLYKNQHAQEVDNDDYIVMSPIRDAHPEVYDEEDLDEEDRISVDGSPQYNETSEVSVIPSKFDSEQELVRFMLKPLGTEEVAQCVVVYDRGERCWTMRDAISGQTLLRAYRRTDGLKRIRSLPHWAIHYASLDAVSTSKKWKGHGTPKTESSYIAKLRASGTANIFQIYDRGENPKRATSLNDVRRELGAVRFDRHNSEKARTVSVCVPMVDKDNQPIYKSGEFFSRLSNGERDFLYLTNTVPRSSVLPKLEDFNGIARFTSIKNIMLFNHEEASPEAVFVLGKYSKGCFHCHFRSEISPVVAFSMAVASIEGMPWLVL